MFLYPVKRRDQPYDDGGLDNRIISVILFTCTENYH